VKWEHGALLSRCALRCAPPSLALTALALTALALTALPLRPPFAHTHSTAQPLHCALTALHTPHPQQPTHMLLTCCWSASPGSRRSGWRPSPQHAPAGSGRQGGQSGRRTQQLLVSRTHLLGTELRAASAQPPILRYCHDAVGTSSGAVGHGSEWLGLGCGGVRGVRGVRVRVSTCTRRERPNPKPSPNRNNASTCTRRERPAWFSIMARQPCRESGASQPASQSSQVKAGSARQVHPTGGAGAPHLR
jgi:hypothetical protein